MTKNQIACGLMMIVMGAASSAGAQLAGVLVDADKPLIEARFDELSEGLRSRFAAQSVADDMLVGEAEWQPPAYDD